jgi:hypothetical protein
VRHLPAHKTKIQHPIYLPKRVELPYLLPELPLFACDMR